MSSLFELPDLVEHAETSPVLPRRARLTAVPDLEPLDFDAAVRTLTPRLQRYATRRLGDRHEAEELVQEALLRAYGHRADLATEDDLAAWTTCVTGRLVIDRLRVRGRSTSVAEVPEGTRTGRDTADVVVARDEARTALDALDAMPPRQAAVLWAREVEGLAYDEIGVRFGMTEPAVRSVLSRARKALRKEFATRGGTLPAAGLVALAPWIDGLTWVDRLRRVAARAAAPAALGALGIGLITGAIVGPASGGDDASPATGALVTAQSADPLPLTPQAARPAVPVRDAAADAAARARSPRSAVAAPAAIAVLGATGLDDTCVDVPATSSLGPLEATSAGGTDCDAVTDDPVLHLEPNIPENPAGVRRVGVETDIVDCRMLPVVPLTSCTSEGEDR